MKIIKAEPVIQQETSNIHDPKKSIQESYENKYQDQMTPGLYRSKPTEENARENASRMASLRLLSELDGIINAMAIALDILDDNHPPVGMPDKETEPESYIEYLEYLNDEMKKRVRKAHDIINATKEVIREKDPNRLMLPFNLDYRSKLRE